MHPPTVFPKNKSINHTKNSTRKIKNYKQLPSKQTKTHASIIKQIIYLTI